MKFYLVPVVHDVAYCHQRGIDYVYNDFARAVSRISRRFIASRSWISSWWHKLQRAGQPHFEEPGCFHCVRGFTRSFLCSCYLEKFPIRFFELRFKSSIVWNLVELQINVDISKDHNDFFVRVSCRCKGAATLFSFFENEDKSLTFLRNITNCITVDLTKEILESFSSILLESPNWQYFCNYAKALKCLIAGI
jgi:hypothetical protein